MVDSNHLNLEGREIMPSEKLNIVSSRIILILSLLALLTVLTGYLEPRHPAPTDEGAGAHIFQIAVAVLMMTGLVFSSPPTGEIHCAAQGGLCFRESPWPQPSRPFTFWNTFIFAKLS